MVLDGAPSSEAEPAAPARVCRQCRRNLQRSAAIAATDPKVRAFLGFGKLVDNRGMASPILEFFRYEHLPDKLQRVSRPICELARSIDAGIPDCAEKTVGLRKLLEAKDCICRAAMFCDYLTGNAMTDGSTSNNQHR